MTTPQILRTSSSRGAIVNTALPWLRLDAAGASTVLEHLPSNAKMLLIHAADRSVVVGTVADALRGTYTHAQGLPFFNDNDNPVPVNTADREIEALCAQVKDLQQRNLDNVVARDNARKERNKERNKANALRQELHLLRNPPNGSTFEERKAARIDVNLHQKRADAAEQRANRLLAERDTLAMRAIFAEELAKLTKAGHDMQVAIVHELHATLEKVAVEADAMGQRAAALARGWAVVFPKYVADFIAKPRHEPAEVQATVKAAIAAFDEVVAEAEKGAADATATQAEKVPA